MLNKENVATEKYKLNKDTTLTVKNKRIEDDLGNTIYKTEIALKYKTTDIHPLSFSDADEISDFVNNIDLSDNQLLLPGIKEEA